MWKSVTFGFYTTYWNKNSPEIQVFRYEGAVFTVGTAVHWRIFVLI